VVPWEKKKKRTEKEFQTGKGVGTRPKGCYGMASLKKKSGIKGGGGGGEGDPRWRPDKREKKSYKKKKKKLKLGIFGAEGRREIKTITQ